MLLSSAYVMIPGSHVAVVSTGPGIDRVGLSLRLAGYEIRDSLAVHLGGRVYIAWLARAPLDGTTVENVVRHGTGALNIGAVRVGDGVGGWGGGGSRFAEGGLDREGGEARPVHGRWPTNVILDGEAAAILGEAGKWFPRVETMGELGAWLERLVT